MSVEDLKPNELAELVTSVTENPDAITTQLRDETSEEVNSLDTEEQILMLQRAQLRNSSHRLQVDEMKCDEPWRELYPAELFFQEAFCRPPFVLPHIGRMADRDVMKLIYETAILSPKKFPDTLFQHLTGHEFKHTRTSKKGMIERAEKFPDLRKIFKYLEPLCSATLNDKKRRDDSGRLKVVPRKKGELESVESDEWKRGALIVSRKPNSIDGPKRHFALYKNIYDLLRAHRHTINFYSGKYNVRDLKEKPELDVLAQLRSEITSTIVQLQQWKGLSDEQKQKIQILIGGLTMILGECTDVYKVQSKMLLAKSQSLKDRGQKYNPGSTCAQLVASYNRVLKRIEAAIGIESTIKKDTTTLEAIKNGGEIHLDAVHESTKTLIKDDWFQMEDFDETAGAQSYVRASAPSLSKKVQQIENMLAKIEEYDSLPAPFPQWAQAAKTNLEAVRILTKRIGRIDGEELLEVGIVDLERVHREACEYAIRAELALRYQKVQTRLTRVLDEILEKPFLLNPASVYREIDDIHRYLDPHFFREEYDFRDGPRKIVFKDENFYPMSQFLRELKHLLKKWQEEKIFVYKEQEQLARRYDGQEEIERYFESMIIFEDRIRELDKAYLNALYDKVQTLDFDVVIQSLNISGYNQAHRTLENFGLHTKDGECPDTRA